MKKILFMLAVLPMMALAFSSCSDDDDNANKSPLIGTWVEDTTRYYEVFHKQFNSDYTGFHWTTDDGAMSVEGKIPFTWSATETRLTIISNNETAVFDYTIEGNRLTTVYEGETLSYIKQ